MLLPKVIVLSRYHAWPARHAGVQPAASIFVRELQDTAASTAAARRRRTDDGPSITSSPRSQSGAVSVWSGVSGRWPDADWNMRKAGAAWRSEQLRGRTSRRLPKRPSWIAALHGIHLNAGQPDAVAEGSSIIAYWETNLKESNIQALHRVARRRWRCCLCWGRRVVLRACRRPQFAAAPRWTGSCRTRLRQVAAPLRSRAAGLGRALAAQARRCRLPEDGPATDCMEATGQLARAGSRSTARPAPGCAWDLLRQSGFRRAGRRGLAGFRRVGQPRPAGDGAGRARSILLRADSSLQEPHRAAGGPVAGRLQAGALPPERGVPI